MLAEKKSRSYHHLYPIIIHLKTYLSISNTFLKLKVTFQYAL
jgi:hypothetical protein